MTRKERERRKIVELLDELKDSIAGTSVREARNIGVPLYVVTRDCCLHNCSRQHRPGKPIRVVQLSTTNRESALKCVKNFSTHEHPYNAELHIVNPDGSESTEITGEIEHGRDG